MKQNSTTRPGHAPGMSKVELVCVICVIILVLCGLVIASISWKRDKDRSANIMNHRNCQQAMRGHQGIKNLEEGTAFTRSDLELYISFPKDVNAEVTYQPGEQVQPMGKLWLRVSPGGDVGSRYGFKSTAGFADW